MVTMIFIIVLIFFTDKYNKMFSCGLVTLCLSVTNFVTFEATLSHGITLDSREQTSSFHTFRDFSHLVL